MRPFACASLLWIGLWLSACSAGPPTAPATAPTVDVEGLCQSLLQATPDAWTPALEALYPHARAAVRPLADALLADPEAPGAQAAVALLGRIGDAGTVAVLRGLVGDRATLAPEAALALGDLGEPAARVDLVACANDRHADATLRTAAACAAVRLGAGPEVADLLAAVMVAGTPAGQQLEHATGLPEKPRWAYERYLIQRLLADCRPDDPGFDTDAPWAELERAGARLAAWLRSR